MRNLIVLLGDYIATHRFITEHVPHDVWAGELARLKAPLGVWAILGNHDWWHNVRSIRGALVKAGIPCLENRAVLLGEGATRFWIAGLGDQIAHWLGPGTFRGEDRVSGPVALAEGDVFRVGRVRLVFRWSPSRVSTHTESSDVFSRTDRPASR